MTVSWWAALSDDLRHLQEQHLRRELRVLEPDPHRPSGVILPDGTRVVSFSSNDYLGLRKHPSVVAAAQEAIARYGTGAGASRLIAGHTNLHEELEDRLATFKATEAALVFSSGYLASVGLLQVLMGSQNRRVPVFFDKLSHACIVDGATATGRNWRTFPHNDTAALERLLRKERGATGSYRAVVVTEGVFSMDGDLAPLPDLVQLCEKYDAVLVVDDAHGTGTIGPCGRGAAAHWNLSGHPRLVHLGTLSKALGSQGGFVAGPRVLIDLLVSRARSFVFDTALAPPCAAAALEALCLLQCEPRHVERLAANSSRFRQFLNGHIGEQKDFTPIVPIHIGHAREALIAAERLLEQGFLVVPIRPPTVPPNTSRLRVALSSLHTDAELESLASMLSA